MKIGSTFARFMNSYELLPRRALLPGNGPSPPLLCLAGPLIVASTVVLPGSGIALLYVPVGDRGVVRSVHKATSVLWFGVMVVHVLGHLLDTARLAPRDHVPTRRLHLRGAPARRVVPGASVVPGFLPGGVMIARADTWVQ